MRRHVFIRLFIVTAILFVPTFMFSGFDGIIAPTVWMIWELVAKFFAGKFAKALVLAAHSGFYIGLFYTAARISFWLIGRIKAAKLQTALHCVILAILVSCSFARVLGYSGWGGRSGAYTFWGAIERYLERLDPAA